MLLLYRTQSTYQLYADTECFLDNFPKDITDQDA